MPDYAQGKIYKLTSTSCEGCYYGSTAIRYLSQRLAVHKCMWKRKNKGHGFNSSAYTLFDNSDSPNDVRISLLETYPCASREDLERRERWWIDNHPCINQRRPGQTHEDKLISGRRHSNKWYANNSDKKRAYYQKHKEDIKAYFKIKYMYTLIHKMLDDPL